MTDTRTIPTRINGRWTLELPPHRAGREQWAAWEVERLYSLSLNILPGDTVYYVGAEEGDLAALCARWAIERVCKCGAFIRDHWVPSCPYDHSIPNRQGGVVLFEPNPRVWPNIRVIFEANKLRPLGWFVGFASDVTDLEPPMLDYEDGDDSFLLRDEAELWPKVAYGPVIGDHGFRSLAEQRDATLQVTLDEWSAGTAPRPDVLTMDVEGAELLVLRGARDILKRDKPLCYISVHPEFMRDSYGQESIELLSLMLGLGYRAHHLETTHEEFWVFAHPEGRGLLR